MELRCAFNLEKYVEQITYTFQREFENLFPLSLPTVFLFLVNESKKSNLLSLLNPRHVANSQEHQRSCQDYEKPELMCKNEMSMNLGCIRRLRFNEA